MIAVFLAAALSFLVGPGEPVVSAPTSIVVATARGQAVVPVSVERGHPVLPVPQLSVLLPITAELNGEWATVEFADLPFRFLLNAPVYSHSDKVFPLVGGAYSVRDTLFVPLQWLSNDIPRLLSEAFHYDPYAARFEDARFTPVATTAPTRPLTPSYRRPAPGSAAARNGFRILHRVVVDAGHGGRDPGNPGQYLPRGVNEKHVTLAISRRVRDRLEAHGVEVMMTRDSDVLPDLRARAPLCNDDCDLFVSIHVNSLARSPGYENVTGFETYFLDDARTAEAERVANMENDALRYETEPVLDDNDPMSFIFKDLHTNEYLRESALLADAVQSHGARVHPGRNRGVSQARFAVLGAARRPAVLVETGFATNRGDAAFLSSATGQQRLAEAIAEGVIVYLRQYEDKVLSAETGG
jgi:N-acetylmuramoyl-L-alanine amidase